MKISKHQNIARPLDHSTIGRFILSFFMALTLSVAITSSAFAGGDDDGDDGGKKACQAYKQSKTWYIKADAAPGGDGSEHLPFATFIEAQAVGNATEGDTLRLLKSSEMVDGGVVLKDCQKLIGSNVPKYFTADDVDLFASITNSTVVGDSNFPGFDNALPVITLANHNTVKSLHLKAKGAAIFGDNVTGSEINKVLITKDTTYAQGVVDSRYCQIIRDNTGSIINSDSILRGCTALSLLEAITGDSYPTFVGAVQLFFGDDERKNSFENSLSRVVIQGDTDSTWQWGVNVSASAEVITKVNMKHIVVRDVGRGYVPFAFDRGHVIVDAKEIAAYDMRADGFIFITGFLCSGISGVDSGFAGTCPAITVPVSEKPKVTIHIDKSEFIGGSEQGMELISFDQGKAEEKFHVSRTTITGFRVGVFLWNPSGYPAEGIYDFGCMSLTSDNKVDRDSCEKAGYTSKGKNLIFGNDFLANFGFLDVLPGYEVLLQGEGDIVAQNNYWGFDLFEEFLAAEYPGRFEDGRVTELVGGERRCQIEYDETDSTVALFDQAPPLRCQINQPFQLTRGATGIPGMLNDAFPRLTPSGGYHGDDD